MSLLATSYRYEKMTAKPALVRALSRQADRVQNDEVLAAKERQSRQDSQVNLMSGWMENLEFKQAAKRGVREAKELQGELTCARSTALMVRQAALRKQMDDEYKIYEKEFHSLGKAFYLKRH